MRTTYQPAIEIQLFETTSGAFAQARDLTLADVAKLHPDARHAYQDEMAAAGLSLLVGLDGSVRVVGVRGPAFEVLS